MSGALSPGTGRALAVAEPLCSALAHGSDSAELGLCVLCRGSAMLPACIAPAPSHCATGVFLLSPFLFFFFSEQLYFPL